MKTFIKKIVLFLAFLGLVIPVFVIIQSTYMMKKNNARGYYYSNLLYFPDDKVCDIVILGSSHAKMLEVCNNWKLTEGILDKKIVNISDFGGSCLNQQILLDYFYAKGNQTDFVLFFIDPFMMVSERFDKENTMNKEPFSLSFLLHAMKGGMDKGVIRNYLKSKIRISNSWAEVHWCEKYEMQVEKLDSVKIRNRVNVLTGSVRIIRANRLKQIQKIDKIIKNVKMHGDKLIFILPPTLIQNEPGYDDLIGFLKRLKKEKSIDYYDFHPIMQDKKYFMDYDHLNRDGVEYFLKNYLCKIFEERQL
jgi:hypothetical protein